VVRLLATGDSQSVDDIKTQLLADIKEAFGNESRMGSKDLVETLAGIEDGPWPTWGKSGKGINQNQLARLLKDFKIYPRTLRLDDSRRLKGYEREWFQSAWDRYLPHIDNQTVTPLRPAKTLTETRTSNRDSVANVTDEEYENTSSTLACLAVTEEKPGTRMGGENTIGPGGNGSRVMFATNLEGNPGGRTLPSCPACGSFALYRENDGTMTCGSCSGGPPAIGPT
jgi:hypothetical protein